MTRSSSSHISASPSRTVSTSSTPCECVGAPAPGAIHCSKMHNCAAPLLAATSMRLSTPSRHGSGSASLMSTTIIGLSLRSCFFRVVERAPGAAERAIGALPIRDNSGCLRRTRLCDAPRLDHASHGPGRCRTASGTRCIPSVIGTLSSSTANGPPMPPSLQKVALVTGAARGIGLAVAKRFLAEGWRVALLDIDGQALESIAKEIGRPEEILTLTADVSDPQAVASAIQQTADRFGRLDALVNNAGVAVFKPLLATTFEEWSRVLAVNLSGPFLCTQAAAPLMAETGGGAIVNVTSISGLRASTLRVAYGTSKAALAHLTKQQAVELAELGIRVNAVAPGPVDTAMAKAVHTPEIRQDYHDHMPLNRYGLEEELAEVIFFLCSERASYITGQVLCVDGGFDSTGIGLPTLRAQMRNA